MKSRDHSNDGRTYREAYGFSEEPFALNPDPKYLFLAPTHSEALSFMLSGIENRRGVVVITGEAGVGKTLLVYALLKNLGEKIKAAFVFNPRLDLKSILESIFRELGLPIREQGENLYSLLIRFRTTLHESLKQSETVAIVVDEAQSLEEEVLEGLFRLATPESIGANSLQILLVGHPDLEAKLNAERFSSFKGRISVKGRINPLTPQEGQDYISYRLKLAGRNISEVFTKESIDKILKFAEGNPRVINLACDRALATGFHESSPMIDLKIAKKALKDLDHLRVRRSRIPSQLLFLRKEPWSKIIRILFFLLSTAVFFLSLNEIFSRLRQ